MAVAFAGSLSRWFASLPGRGDAARLRAGVEAWRRDLCAAVAPKVGEQLVWDEGAAAHVTTDLGDAGGIALRLLAFYGERAELEWPDTAPPLLELDPHWRAAADAKFPKTLYGQLLACRVWLPGDFPVTIRAPLPDGDTAEIGSLDLLADQLRWLNARTFQADADDVVAWRALPAPAGGELLAAARRGYAGLLQALELARAERLPLLVREA